MNTYPQPPVYYAPKPPGRGLAVAGMVLGIIGVAVGLVPLFFFFAGVLGVLAVVFGAIGRKKGSRVGVRHGVGTAGIVLGVVAVGLAVVGVAIVANTANELDDSINEAGAATNSANTENPPTDDVELTGCATDEIGWVTASGTITNHSSESSTYFVEVEFTVDGTRFAEGIASSSTVAPGQSAEWEASGLEDAREGYHCRLLSVERYAS